jgi:hypothetical protein
MEKINLVKICNAAQERAERLARPEIKAWGISWMVDTEAEALRIAYAQRNAPHGVKAEHCPNVGKFMVTVFNATAKECGIDGAK